MSPYAGTVSNQWVEKQMRWAGILTVCGLCLALLYEVHSSPYTMSGFLMGSPALFFAAIFIYYRTRRRQSLAKQARVTPLNFQPGQTIYKQGDPADSIFLITKGEVETLYEHPEHGKITLSRLGPRDSFGEGAAFNQGTRRATVVATSPVEVMVVDPSDFLWLYTHLPELKGHLKPQGA